MKKLLFSLVGAAILLGAGSAAQAQQATPVSIGAQVSFAEDADLGVGARVEVGLPQLSPRIFAIGSFDWFFPDGFDYFEINANLGYSVPVTSTSISPYVGGGLNFARVSVDVFGDSHSDTDLGLNVLGGMKFKPAAARFTPFVEARFELSGGEQFVISGGILF